MSHEFSIFAHIEAIAKAVDRLPSRSNSSPFQGGRPCRNGTVFFSGALMSISDLQELWISDSARRSANRTLFKSKGASPIRVGCSKCKVFPKTTNFTKGQDRRHHGTGPWILWRGAAIWRRESDRAGATMKCAIAPAPLLIKPNRATRFCLIRDPTSRRLAPTQLRHGGRACLG